MSSGLEPVGGVAPGRGVAPGCGAAPGRGAEAHPGGSSGIAPCRARCAPRSRRRSAALGPPAPCRWSGVRAHRYR